MRFLKTLLIAFASMFCLLYGLQNLMNLGASFSFVQQTLSMQGHELYPQSIGPAITSETLVWVVLSVIIILELLAGFLILRGAYDMLKALRDTAAEFHKAKHFAAIGLSLAIVLWFGLFSALGGAYFQMWQTQSGNTALEGAFWYSIQMAAILLILLQKDSEDLID
ncbi:DUF2165 family protein [Lacimicrobium alkaliphilum]|uniref:Membrane protein n=2 Tax=Lacimicrobium alkaliphilum TaxID=1526571 RepID=A0ABQ1QZZ0_9ALTE|nr:DUF2165 domain-containing protein [Lacimicrobium alkaliphilum]GGD52609.1 membrane protein [Lacimicrobium alkaliphilum]